MLDLFTIFSKGGIVLWYFQGTCEAFGPPVNSLIKSIILQERGGDNSFSHESLTLKYKLDNEFELVFVVAYQNIIRLSYIDKFLDDVQKEFRDKYQDVLNTRNYGGDFEFTTEFRQILKNAKEESEAQGKNVKMRTFDESSKSKKTVNSMIKNAGTDDGNLSKKKMSGGTDGSPKKNKKKKKNKGGGNKGLPTNGVTEVQEEPVVSNGTVEENDIGEAEVGGTVQEETRMQKLIRRGIKVEPGRKKDVKKAPVKKGKQDRDWGINGNPRVDSSLDYSNPKQETTADSEVAEDDVVKMERKNVGQSATIQNLVEESSDEEEDLEEEEVTVKQKAKPQKGSSYGLFSMFSGLVGSKKLTKEDMGPVMEKMRDHLIAKNVAQEIAEKLCDSVAKKLEGKVLGTFDRVATVVRAGMEESLVQILTPRRRVDILRDALEAKSHGRPYSITFCGVNGVGKSTNLAKICFWLVENNLRVLIAACDTFRAGAVEQLRTHHRRLNALHPTSKGSSQVVFLYEKGYGKDSAGIAMEAIKYARDYNYDVVLIDTAGRMQDNEPLMKALTKLIKVNQPDLVLFVGEALVGNEAVDQLTKFNRALADFSDAQQPRLIDGIVLTKFDTIDDKVGAAISMTYTTGQPIVFVGTGQTYSDLRNLNAKAVINTLLKA